MKRLKIGLSILAIVLVAGSVAAIMTLNSFSRSEYEEVITEAVKDATGRELDFNGTLDVNISLTPGFSADGISLQNAPWGSRDKMLSLEHVEVQLKLIPLIFGEVELNQLKIVGLNLLLETDQQGKGNWELPATGGDDEDAMPDQETDEQGGFLTAAVLGKAVIHDANIVYKDGITGSSQNFSIIDFSAQMESPSAPLVLALQATFDTVSLKLAGELDGVPELLSGGALGLDMSASVLGVELAVEGTIAKPLEANDIEIMVKVQGDSLTPLAEFIAFQVDDYGAFQLAANLALSDKQVKLSNLSIDIADTLLEGDLAVTIGSEPLKIAATLHSPRIDLTRLLPADNSAAVTPDQAVATGQQNDDSNGRIFSDDPLPFSALDALDGINAMVNLVIAELVVDSKTTIRNLDIGLDAAPKTLTLDPLKLNIMDATVNGQVTLEVVNNSAIVATKMNIRHPNIGDLVEDDGETMLSGGPLKLNIDVTGRGPSIHHIMASLDGMVALDMGSAKIDNKWVQMAFADVAAVITKRGKTEPVDLHCVTAELKIEQGIVVPNSLVVDTRGISLFGAGDVNLGNESLALDFDRLAATVSASGVLPPFRVRGTLASPTGNVDAAALASKTLGFGASLVVRGGVEFSKVSAETGPDRCRQRLVVFEEIKKDRERSKEKAIDVAGQAGQAATKAATEATKNVFGKVSDFFNRNKDKNKERK